MNLDSFFTKGDSHKVCQDYTVHGETEDFAYAIVCDGCSSSQKVDIGARILAELFAAGVRMFDLKFYLEGYPERWQGYLERDVKRNVVVGMHDICYRLDLHPSAFDATLLAVVYAKKQNQIITFQWGDGIITTVFKDGNIRTSSIKYSMNAPCYFSYEVWQDRGKQYFDYFKDQVATLTYTMTGIPDLSLDNKNGHFDYWSAENIRFIHLSSDGIESFQNENENTIDVASEFTNFKGFEGEFVQRRMNRILKELKKKGGSHYDDLGVAAIAFD